MKTLYIVRGLPGSGKSTLASKMVPKSRIKEADMYHIDNNGVYNFNPSNIKASHEWCYSQVSNLLKRSNRDCVVANTFTQRWEYQPYMDLAKEYGFDFMIIDCHGEWDNIHNVPEEVMVRMSERWEPHHSR